MDMSPLNKQNDEHDPQETRVALGILMGMMNNNTLTVLNDRTNGGGDEASVGPCDVS